MPAFRSVVSVLLRGWETFLYDSQVAPCGRPPAAAVLGRHTYPAWPGRLDFGRCTATHSRSTAMRSKPSTPDHRRRARQIAAGLTILALFATACSGTFNSNSDGPAQATATTAVALQPL